MSSPTGGSPLRLTKAVLQQVLSQNEGFRKTTSFVGKNFKEDISYRIQDGVLHMLRKGKTSWAASRFEEVTVADIDQVRRFVKKFLTDLNTDGIK